MNRQTFLALVLGVVMTLSGVSVHAAPVSIAVVDMERVMRDSEPAKKGAEHLAQVQKVLQDGMDRLKTEFAKAPEAERNQELVNGQRVLQQQMLVERQAVQQIISTLLLEEVKAWRAKNGGVVIARQNLLDSDPALDITPIILTGMNKKNPQFAELPKVSIKNRKADAPGGTRKKDQPSKNSK